MKTLYEAYDQDDVAMEDIAGVTLDDLYLYMCMYARLATKLA